MVAWGAMASRYTLRVPDGLDERLKAHLRAMEERARAAGVPVPTDSAALLSLLERGLDAYEATFGAASGERRGKGKG